MLLFQNRIIDWTPNFVEMEVIETEPGVKAILPRRYQECYLDWDSHTGTLFVNTGDRVRVDTVL